MGLLAGLVSGTCHALAWILIRNRTAQLKQIIIFGTLSSIFFLEVPLVVFAIGFMDMVLDIDLAIWVGLQALGIFLAVRQLNIRIYNYMQSKQLLNNDRPTR